jgi:hypothetical protein
MRMRGEVLEVKTKGDKLEVKVQASGDADAFWRDKNVITFECPDLPAQRKALHIGRKVRIDIVTE